MQNDIPIKLNSDSKPAVTTFFSEAQATILELIAVRAFSVGINSLYKNAIDALYDEKSSRFYHDYQFPGPSELKALLENEELQRINALPKLNSFKNTFAEPNFNGIASLCLSNLGSLKFMKSGDYFQICHKSFRELLVNLNFDEIFNQLHDKAFFILFPEEYDELLDSEHDFLTDWLDYYSKLHWNRTKSDISAFLVDWIEQHANLNEDPMVESNGNKLKYLGISDRIYHSVSKIKKGNNPVALLTPILVPQDFKFIGISELSNIQFD